MFCLFYSGVLSQEISEKPPAKWNSFLHMESGLVFPGGSIKEGLNIRQNISGWNVHQQSYGNVHTQSSGFILGVKWEFFNVRLRSGVSTGLRYAGYNTEISGYSSSIADFFYLRYSMFDSETKFTRVKSLNETNRHISVPVEFRTEPLQFEKFALFAKAGADFSWLNTGRSTSINFHDNDMNIHHDEILKDFVVPANKHYSTLYWSVGVRAGREGSVNYSLEAFLPSRFLTGNNFTLTEADNFQGVVFSIQVPVK
jgi:hypothetical protein